MKFRVLVTGSEGFVGPYLISSLRSLNENIEVIPTSRFGGLHPTLGPVERFDVNNEHTAYDIIEKVAPTHVIHLAGWAAIPVAAVNPYATWYTHLFGTLNVAQAILARAPECTLLYVGTGQIYGKSALSGQALDENAVLQPTDTYTASKAAADLALGALVGKGLRCVRLRPFNHTGPRQTENFVIPSFAFQIARIKAGLQPPVMHVGNLDVERDFLDVRDVASAYALAMFAASKLPEGCTLNISSGKSHSIRGILEWFIEYSGTSVAVESDAARLRAGEIATFVGDSNKARSLLGWAPKYSLDETLRNVFDWASESTRQEFPGRLGILE